LMLPLIALSVRLGWGMGPFALAALLFGAVKGALDVSANAQAVAAERDGTKPIVSSCHGCWSLGSLLGAGTAAFALRSAIPPGLTLLGVGAVLLMAALAMAGDLRTGDHVKSGSGPRSNPWPTGRLAWLGALAFLALFCEGAVADWSAVYLAGPVGVSPASAAFGFAIYMTAMTSARFAGDNLVATFGPAGLLRAGGLLVAVGLGGAILFRTFPAALVGFGLVGMGLANAVPVIFRSAGKEHDAGGAIAAVSTVGYLGFLAGPPMIGVMSEALGLPVALLAVVAFGVMIALGARIALGSVRQSGGWLRRGPSSALRAPSPGGRRREDERSREVISMRTSKFPYALAAIDIDDTLVGPDKTIGLENRRAVEKLRELGCRVILASGRRHANMLSYCEELGLDDYVVSCQGARVEHPRTGQVLRTASLDPADTSALVAEGLERGHTVLLWLAEGVFAQAETAWVDVYRGETGNDPVSIADLRALSDRPAEKVVWAADPAQIAEAHAELDGRYDGRLTVTVTNDWYLEVTAREAHKADGVAAVAASAGIAREAVLAFGDGHNDVSLLSWAGLGVAMPHGRASARAAAKVVGTDGDPESALARAVDLVAAGFAGAPLV
jgi:Cof subfamily protein (haloacid dehalogenase superfamily)